MKLGKIHHIELAEFECLPYSLCSRRNNSPNGIVCISLCIHRNSLSSVSPTALDENTSHHANRVGKLSTSQTRRKWKKNKVQEKSRHFLAFSTTIVITAAVGTIFNEKEIKVSHPLTE
eukprot:GCRY01004382.1.p2 GENE.GCRY01004382.1~~GCRY01004382.1.p2  ORF type:complete len:118 (-),score=5.11 GCRY01004382.1:420-773(-)